MIQDSFFSIYKSSYPNLFDNGPKKLTLVLKDGRSFGVGYSKQQERIWGQASVIFNSEDLNVIKENGILPQGEEEQTLYTLLDKASPCPILRLSQQVAQDKLIMSQDSSSDEKKEGKSARYGSRIFHIITGALVTPTEMLTGIAKLAASCAAVFAFMVANAAAYAWYMAGMMTVGTNIDTMIYDNEEVKDIEKQIFENTKHSFRPLTQWAAKQARMALLHMIPIMGAQLANQYRIRGTLKGFADTPAFGGLLAKAGLSVPKIVYGFRKTDSIPKEESKRSCYAQDSYLQSKFPWGWETNEQLTSSNDREVFVRISVKSYRLHDGTMLFPEGSKNIKNKTAVLYHGNCQHRDGMKETAEEYLNRGYNVLLSSYAGDTVVEGTGTDYKIVPTKCSEHLMREDAEADFEFLKGLGVEHFAVHGISLGGAQALNFTQVIQKNRKQYTEIFRHSPPQFIPNPIRLDSVLLEKTFTNMPDVAGNVIRNIFKSRFLATIVSDFTKRYLLEEKRKKYCDGLDNEEKLKVLSRDENFAHTRFCCIGAGDDEIMGNPKSPLHNFARNLSQAVGNQDNVLFDLQARDELYAALGVTGHNAPTSFERAMDFLFPSGEQT